MIDTSGMLKFVVNKSPWRKLLICFCVNSAIAFGQSHSMGYPLGYAMTYSNLIGFSIVGLISLGSALFVTNRKMQWIRHTIMIPMAVGLGLWIGYGVGDLFTGLNLWKGFVGRPANVIQPLVLSLIVSAVLTYYFMNRERMSLARETLARAEASAQAAQRHAAEAQLKLLETQLEPHMLFNTLANLRVLIATDAPRAQTMLDHLIAYLRATLSASRASTHTLAQEFDRLADYLALMQVRMGPRLQFTLDLPAPLQTHSVPPLLLQALVENSIKHGLEPKVQGGSVNISARQIGQQIELVVADTGVGLPSDVPSDVTSQVSSLASAGQMPTNPEGSFGVAQVRERLQAAYGNRAALEFVAGNKGGMRARVTFPSEISDPP